MKILNDIQQKLKVPKQKNVNVAYKSRSAEDIVEMVKPLLEDNILTLSDEIIMLGDRFYVKATASIFNNLGVLIASTSAFAREAEEQKFMSQAQVTGSTSSYARKYALNGLFAIDDTQDDDTRENHTVDKIEANKAILQPKALTLVEQISKSIDETKDLSSLNAIVVKTQASLKLSDTEKQTLLNEAEFKTQELTQ